MSKNLKQRALSLLPLLIRRHKFVSDVKMQRALHNFGADFFREQAQRSTGGGDGNARRELRGL
jgi:hypothetical protein